MCANTTHEHMAKDKATSKTYARKASGSQVKHVPEKPLEASVCRIVAWRPRHAAPSVTGAGSEWARACRSGGVAVAHELELAASEIDLMMLMRLVSSVAPDAQRPSRRADRSSLGRTSAAVVGRSEDGDIDGGHCRRMNPCKSVWICLGAHEFLRQRRSRPAAGAN